MQKLFVSDGFFTVSAVVGVLSLFVFAVCTAFGFIPYPAEITLYSLLLGACLLSLFVSYKKHDKNVMKGMIGVLFGAMAVSSFQYIAAETQTDRFFGILYIVALIFLAVNHFVINGSHRASVANVYINQVLCIALWVVQIAWNVLYGMEFAAWLEAALCILSSFGITATLLCVESRLDAYRINRENAGWTEETGYPEGYVHECDKK